MVDEKFHGEEPDEERRVDLTDQVREIQRQITGGEPKDEPTDRLVSEETVILNPARGVARGDRIAPDDTLELPDSRDGRTERLAPLRVHIEAEPVRNLTDIVNEIRKEGAGKRWLRRVRARLRGRGEPPQAPPQKPNS
jgi:hypothetical protein